MQFIYIYVKRKEAKRKCRIRYSFNIVSVKSRPKLLIAVDFSFSLFAIFFLQLFIEIYGNYKTNKQKFKKKV